MESEERSEPDQLLNVMGYLPPSNDRQVREEVKTLSSSSRARCLNEFQDKDERMQEMRGRRSREDPRKTFSPSLSSISFPAFPRGSILKHMAMSSSWVEGDKRPATTRCSCFFIFSLHLPRSPPVFALSSHVFSSISSQDHSWLDRTAQAPARDKHISSHSHQLSAYHGMTRLQGGGSGGRMH